MPTDARTPQDAATPPHRATPPALPPVRANLFHIVVPITALWFVALVILLFRVTELREHHHLVWLWTSAAGTFLGGLGLAVYSWQRSATRKGRRSAQRLALDEDD